MPKFIEINRVTHATRQILGEDVHESIYEPVLVNADHIRTIIPQGETCLIVFPDENFIEAAPRWLLAPTRDAEVSA